MKITTVQYFEMLMQIMVVVNLKTGLIIGQMGKSQPLIHKFKYPGKGRLGRSCRDGHRRWLVARESWVDVDGIKILRKDVYTNLGHKAHGTYGKNAGVEWIAIAVER
ncbi:hypothetical protein L6452_01955 [Arctium lappa]|uniref:Uncharacterized protein n=1 Tax=Arctium lappa TaxID=4217 RepID=A0ACB9FII4_ARCLA|nr:hypothetical protein L6452_01955 [Arctium lappa]